ncbi:hypothetical protein Tco_0815239, partial [Tanacetum coccineum]
FLGVLAVKVDAVIGSSSLALGLGKGVRVEKPGGGVISLPLVMPEKPTVKGVRLRVASSHTGNHREDDFTPLKTIRRFLVSSKYTKLLLEENNLGKKPFKDVVPLRVRGDPLFNQIATYPCNIQTFPDPILYLAGLKSFWKHSPKKPIIYHHGREMDFKSFMVKGIDVEFHFELEGGVGDGEEESPSNRSINNEALVIDVNPLNLTLISHVAENVRETVTGPSLKEACRKLQKVPPQASKFVGDVSDPLDVDSDPDIHEFPSARELKDSADCHFVVAHVTPLSWKQHLRDISLEKRYDIMTRVSCDVIWEREIEKDKAYAELERKCNDALQDLDKILLCWTYAQRLRLYKGRLRSYMVSIAGLFLRKRRRGG